MKLAAKIEDAQVAQMNLTIAVTMTVDEWRQLMRVAGDAPRYTGPYYLSNYISEVLGHVSRATQTNFTSPKHEATEDQRDAVIEEIAAERRRQIDVEGWTADHDLQHPNGELAEAAAAYALADGPDAPLVIDGWPWEARWWKPKDRRRNLIRAAALIVAEIERLDRSLKSIPADKEKA